MNQTQNVNPAEAALNKLFSTIELLSAKIDELNERVDYVGSFVELDVEDDEQTEYVEPPGQLAGVSFDILNKVLGAKDANSLRAYFLRVLSLFRKYIKSIVVFGSSKTKTGMTSSSDIDVAFIVDDTDIKRFTLEQLKERLFVKMAEIAKDFSDKIHAQTYPLAEFWASIIKPNPVILTLLRDGVAVYDTGYFVPIQMLYKAGGIIPTRETIDSNMSSAEAFLVWAEDTMSTKLSRDLFDSVVAAGQALLMELGYLPPVPKETTNGLLAAAVEKEKLLTKEDVTKADDVIKWYKSIEHGEIKRVNGEEFHKKYTEAKEVVDKIMKVLDKEREKKGAPHPIIDKESLKATEQKGNYQPKQ
jgi:predicted nucleotidyltransferase